MSSAEILFDASTTIYKQIAALKRGRPIAEAKASSFAAKARIRKKYNAEIATLEAQYKAVYAASTASV